MHIFISHATANAQLAEGLAVALKSGRGDITTFLSSRPGDIRADADWMPAVEEALRNADAYVTLLTPESIFRVWVAFEAGAAWFAQKRFVLARVQALAPDEIPSPLSARQVYPLDEPEGLAAIFGSLDIPLENAPALAASLAALDKRGDIAGNNEPAWEGIELNGVFYAWSGPMLHLRDEAGVPSPPALLERLKEHGLTERWANPERLGQHVGRGLAQIFATDRKAWRRPIIDRGRIMVVGSETTDGKRSFTPTAASVRRNWVTDWDSG